MQYAALERGNCLDIFQEAEGKIYVKMQIRLKTTKATDRPLKNLEVADGGGGGGWQSGTLCYHLNENPESNGFSHGWFVCSFGRHSWLIFVTS